MCVPLMHSLNSLQKNVSRNLKKKTASVELSEEVANETLTKAVVDAGYEVKKID